MSGESPAPAFVDTNILVYAAVADEDPRALASRSLLDELTRDNVLRTSTQVLQELFVALTRKVERPLSPDQALLFTDQIAEWPVFAPEYRDLRQAMLLSSRASLSFWDALIVVAAARSGARVLYTEDLQHGQTLLGIQIVNPFLT